MGRVFVVQADLTKLVVDDVVIPCDGDVNVHPGFSDLFNCPLEEGTFSDPSYRRPTTYQAVSPGLWKAAGFQGRPRVWLLDSSIDADEEVEPAQRATRLAQRIGVGLSAVLISDRTRAVTGGARRRIAMTLMGIKQGGFRDQYAEVITATLQELGQLCESADVDIVLSVLDRADYAAVQHVRQQAPQGSEDPYTLAAAQRLAQLANEGRLVLFIGAGASVGAGLSDWGGLLDGLAKDVRLNLAELEDFRDLDPRDQALLIGAASGADEQDVRRRIADAFQGQHYPLTQALLASLRLEQALTTNYDLLYETAYNTGSTKGTRLLVLPREPYQSGHPWLMKIHGDARAPATIVLSRDDYIRFDAESVPMASVLQSAMLTAHLLFVGYSVSDENVVRLARQVVTFRRNAWRAKDSDAIDGNSSVGTVLVPTYQPAKARLWEGVLDYVPLPGGPPPTDGSPDAWWQARVEAVEEFLDLLGMYACQQAPYLMVDRYEGLLGPAELKLKQALVGLRATLATMPDLPPAAAPIQALLQEYGERPES